MAKKKLAVVERLRITECKTEARFRNGAKKKLTLEELGELVFTDADGKGFSTSYKKQLLAHWNNGKMFGQWTPGRAKRLAAALGVTVDELIVA